MRKIDLSELVSAIEDELEEYGQKTSDQVREVVDSVTEEAVETLKATSPKKSGQYAKGWKATATNDTNTGLTKTIHNQTPGLTHLIENGHAKQNGGRVEGTPHIAPVEKQAIQTLESRLKQKL